jgi:hypothetical protein
MAAQLAASQEGLSSVSKYVSKKVRWRPTHALRHTSQISPKIYLNEVCYLLLHEINNIFMSLTLFTYDVGVLNNFLNHGNGNLSHA